MSIVKFHTEHDLPYEMVNKDNNLKWFRYGQNNSRGVFRGPARDVYIQAENEHDANDTAEDNGIYFDGCEDGSDCRCCGDRWHRPYGDGEENLIIDKQDLKNEVSEADGIPALMIVPFNHEPIFPNSENVEKLGLSEIKMLSFEN